VIKIKENSQDFSAESAVFFQYFSQRKCLTYGIKIIVRIDLSVEKEDAFLKKLF
jgi:hypothetical protein